MQNKDALYFIEQGKLHVEIQADHLAASRLNLPRAPRALSDSFLAGRLCIRKVKKFTPLDYRALRVHCNGITHREEYAKPGVHIYLAPTFQIRLDKRMRLCRIEYLEWGSRLCHEIRLLTRWIIKTRLLDRGLLYVPGILISVKRGASLMLAGQQECGLFNAASSGAFKRHGGYGVMLDPEAEFISDLPDFTVCKYESGGIYAEGMSRLKPESFSAKVLPRAVVFVHSWGRRDAAVEKISAREAVLRLDELNRRAYEYFFTSQRDELSKKYAKLRRRVDFFQLSLGTDSKQSEALLLSLL